MTNPSPDVRAELLELLTGDVDYDTLDDDVLFALAARCVAARETLYEVTTRLNRRHTFAQIGERLGVHEVTASRMAKRPSEDLRRRHRSET